MERGALLATVHGVSESDVTQQLNTHLLRQKDKSEDH